MKNTGATIVAPDSRAGGEAFRGGQLIPAAHQLRHFVPVDFAAIETQRYPAPRADVRRQIKPVRLRRGQRLIFPGQHLAGNRYDSVAVVVVQEISKSLLPDQELR